MNVFKCIAISVCDTEINSEAEAFEISHETLDVILFILIYTVHQSCKDYSCTKVNMQSMLFIPL